MVYWELGSHARSVYLTQDTSREGEVALVQQKEDADTRIIANEVKEMCRKGN